MRKGLPAVDEEIAPNAVLIMLVSGNGQFRIASTVEFPIHLDVGHQLLNMRAIQEIIPPLCAPGRETDANRAVHEDVVVDHIHLPAMDLNTAKMTVGGVFKIVPINKAAADRIVKADRSLTARNIGTAADVLPVIIADDRTTIGDITPHVDRALIIRFRHEIIAQVVLNQMIVPLNPHGAGRPMVEPIVHHARAASIKEKCGVIGTPAPRKAKDLVILDDNFP